MHTSRKAAVFLLVSVWILIGIIGCTDTTSLTDKDEISPEGSTQSIELDEDSLESNSVTEVVSMNEQEDNMEEAVTAEVDIAETKEIIYTNSRHEIVTTTGEAVSCFDNYEVCGPFSEGLVLVRWEHEVDDKWGVGTDGSHHYGFADEAGNIQIDLESTIETMGLPIVDESGKRIAFDSNAFFQENHAVLTCRYGLPDSNAFRFDIAIDKSGEVVAWANINASYIDSAGLSFTSWPDNPNLGDFPQASLSKAYRNGVLRASRGNVMTGHTVVLDENGQLYANLHVDDIPVIQSASIINKQYIIGNDWNIYAYTPGPDAAHSEQLIDRDAFKATEDFGEVEFVNLTGQEGFVAVNGSKKTPEGTRTIAGIYDLATGTWATEQILGGTAGDSYNDLCSVTIKGGYNQNYPDSAGLLAGDGTWVLEPGRVYVGTTEYNGGVAKSIMHYVGNYWLVSTETTNFLFDASNPASEPLEVVNPLLFS